MCRLVVAQHPLAPFAHDARSGCFFVLPVRCSLTVQIPEAKSLLMDYPFADLVKSLQTKYSELPEGWQKTDAWVESEARRRRLR